MPMHYDGVFKVKTLDNGKVTADPPQFQMFQCRHAPSVADQDANAGGRTLFANTALIYRQLFENDASPYASYVRDGNWTVFTPTNQSFGGDPLELSLVDVNPLNNHKTIRWHEPWCVRTLFTGGCVRLIELLLV